MGEATESAAPRQRSQGVQNSVQILMHKNGERSLPLPPLAPRPLQFCHPLPPRKVVTLGHVGSKVRSRWLHFGSLWSSYRLALEQKVDKIWLIVKHYMKVVT